MSIFVTLNTRKKLINIILWALALVPLFTSSVTFFGDQLNNPFEYLISQSGQWTLYFFLFSFSISPFCRIASLLAKQSHWERGKRLADWNFIAFQRRMLGLVCFYYACLHFTIYFYFEIDFSLTELWLEISERTFILVASLAFIILSILAVTSLTYFQRTLKRNWKNVHLLVHPAGLLLILHVILEAKTLEANTVIIVSVFTCLCIERLLHLFNYLRDKKKSELARLARRL